MKSRVLVAVVAILTLLAGLVIMAQEPGAAKPKVQAGAAKGEKPLAVKPKVQEMPGAVVVQEVQATAVVKAVDLEKRLVALALPGGETRTFTAPPEVKNLPQVKVGDQVNATYLESVAIEVKGPKEPAGPATATTVRLAAEGAKPGAYVANTQTLTATVTAIDHKTRVITLTGPKGNSLTFKVGPDVKRLDEVNKGDQIVVSYTESLLLDVTAPGAPSVQKDTSKQPKAPAATK
jgi:hypothetical protein